MKKSLHEQFGRDAPRVLSGIMQDQAEKTPLPTRFQVKVADRPSAVVILDTETCRSSRVGLFAYGECRRVLNDLFGEGSVGKIDRGSV
jgi:hypothetical protein